MNCCPAELLLGFRTLRNLEDPMVYEIRAGGNVTDRLRFSFAGPAELRAERVDPVRERRDGIRSRLSDCLGRRFAHHDLLAAVHHRPLHGTPRISQPGVQTRHAGDEERPSGVQSGGLCDSRKTPRRFGAYRSID